ncbi:kynurenine 3-monooxygenase [[Candida] railenensis]|uniref:Kynurenine 3-monooxygenase n=1 Tax=[Candida] railenensis TaxID=45579 RepID=A0A9P0QR24_9ASCO|nr:kynurenine 3-monooxygenase [[Candida] railenensis]
MQEEKPGVGIVGAGLVGCLAALAFAAKGYSVSLFELRPDPSTIPQKQKNFRSINLAVSDRGIRALRYVDEEMASRVLENVIPMYGRMIHDLKGNQESQNYGLFGESINSIDRSYLNDLLLDEIKRNDYININFNYKLSNVDNLNSHPTLTFQDENSELKTYEFDYVVGADGAHSQFRYQMQKSMRMNFSQEYVDMQYLELSIPAKNDAGEFHYSPNHLHIWPRHDFMLIALANKEGSFTVTFFSPWKIIESFQNKDEWLAFFTENFPDAVKLIGEEELKEAFDKNPRGSLMQVGVYPYHHPSGRAILIGDAAHSMVPFYGQGMNCGFEDVRVLMELIESQAGDTSAAFRKYSEERHEDLKSICKLAMDNYHEMSSKVTSKWFLMRKKIDYALGKLGNGKYFQWIPMYTMISFRGDIPYSKAVAIEERQAKILGRIEIGTLALVLGVGLAKALHHIRK